MNSFIWPFFNCLFLIIKLICIFLLFHGNSTLFETSKWQLNRIFKLALINDALKNLVTFKAKLALPLFFSQIQGCTCTCTCTCTVYVSCPPATTYGPNCSKLSKKVFFYFSGTWIINLLLSRNHQYFILDSNNWLNTVR